MTTLIFQIQFGETIDNRRAGSLWNSIPNRDAYGKHDVKLSSFPFPHLADDVCRFFLYEKERQGIATGGQILDMEREKEKLD